MKQRRRNRSLYFLYILLGASAVMIGISAFTEADNEFVLNFGSNSKIYITNDTSEFNGTVKVNGSQVCTLASGCGSAGGAPATASYLTLGLDGTLTSERVLTAGAGITTTDTGANGVLRVNVSAVTCAAGNYSTFNGSHFTCSPDTNGSAGATYTFGVGLNVSGTHVTVANLTACNAVTEYSVWNGSAWLCDNDGSGSGTVTQVSTGNGLTGGPITTTGTVSINATVSGAGNYSYWNGSAWLTRADNDTDTNTINNVTAIGVTGTTTKTLQLNQSFGITVLNASWTDADTTYTNSTGINLTGTTFSLDTRYTDARYYPYATNPSAYYNSSTIVAAVGNWTGNQSLYSSTTQGDSRWGNQTFNATCSGGQFLQAAALNKDGTQNSTVCGTPAGSGGGNITGQGSANLLAYWTNTTNAGNTTAIRYESASNSLNLTDTNSCVYMPGGGRMCGNSTCITLFSPNGNTKVQACN